MVNYDIIIQDLSVFTREEQIYQEYFQLTREDKSLAPFLARYKKETEYLSYLQHPENIDSSPTEDKFISSGRNVSIVKHPRFFPVFYHKHDFFEIIFVLSGTCTQIFEDRKIRLTTGDLCIMAPNVVHAIEVFDSSVILNIIIRRSTFLDIFINTVRDKTQISMFFLSNIYEKNKVPYLLFHTGEDDTIRNYLLDMYMEQLQLDEYSDRIICSILTIFFTQLIRLHRKDMEIPQSSDSRSALETQVFNYIVNHYADLSLEQVAAYFHFSVPYCSKLIKKISCQSFSDLQENIRLQQSENLLLYTQMSVADISDKIGYKNPETFIRMFKRHHGMTPSRFRKLNTEKGAGILCSEQYLPLGKRFHICRPDLSEG